VFLSLIIISFLTIASSNREEHLVRLGVFTDDHYCQCDIHSDRYFENTTTKPEYSISNFNELNLDFVINLGDIVDMGYHSNGTVISLLEGNSVSVYHVLGNAEYNVDDSYTQKRLINLE
jgi:predicted MPP superfamily phosphohydrolase